MASRQAAAADLPGIAGGAMLLVRALACQHSADAGLQWWRLWRDAVDLDQVSWEEMQILPMLNPRLPAWLEGDPSAGILQGIVRRAWTETQIRLNAVQAVIALLEKAGIWPVMPSGAAAIALACRARGAIRPLPDLRVRIRREHLPLAAAALAADGWLAGGAVPQGPALDRLQDLYHEKTGFQLFLQWRPIPVAPSKAARYEKELRANAAEHSLLAALCARGGPDHDVIPWQADVAMVPHGEVNWSEFARLAGAYAPQAFERLDEMRALGLAVPPLNRPGLSAALTRFLRRLRFR